jgi:ABC-type uncharacterized transport system permease subunit
MSQKYGRAVLGALILGALLAVAVEVAWPGAWRWGLTPQFVVTVALAVVASVVPAMRRRS